MSRLLNLGEFPTLGEDFDIVSIDLHRVDKDEVFYTPSFSYLVNDDENQRFDSGFTLRTGMTFQNYEDAHRVLGALIRSGFFIVDVSAISMVYDVDGNVVDEVNWNDMDALIEQTKEHGEARVLH